jgi:hypothetical protein
MSKPKTVIVKNVNVSGYESRVNAEKYEAMRAALLRALPASEPGLTQAEMLAAIQPFLNQDLWPGGEKSGWWMKTVQLDLEASGQVKRNATTRPTRWYCSS